MSPYLINKNKTELVKALGRDIENLNIFFLQEKSDDERVRCSD